MMTAVSAVTVDKHYGSWGKLCFVDGMMSAYAMSFFLRQQEELTVLNIPKEPMSMTAACTSETPKPGRPKD